MFIEKSELYKEGIRIGAIRIGAEGNEIHKKK